MSKRITITVTDEMQEHIERAMKQYGFTRQSEAVAFMVSAYWGEHDFREAFERQIIEHYKDVEQATGKKR